MADNAKQGKRITSAHIRIARANIRNAAKLGKKPDERIVAIAEQSLHGDHFDADAVWRKTPRMAG